MRSIHHGKLGSVRRDLLIGLHFVCSRHSPLVSDDARELFRGPPVPELGPLLPRLIRAAAFDNP